MARNEKGFGTAGIIVIIVAALIVAGVIVWRLIDANKPADNQTQTQNAADTPASQGETSQPTTNPNQGYVVLKEWNVRFKPTQALGEVRYAKIKDFPQEAYKFTTTALIEREPNCSESSNAITLGSLTRSQQESPEYGTTLATIDGYYYQYRGSDAACSENPANYEFESNVRMELEKSLKTLEAAK